MNTISVAATHLCPPGFSCVGLYSCPSRLGFVGAQLTCLNLNGNRLAHIPAEIGCLKGLRILSLEKNKLYKLPVSR